MRDLAALEKLLLREQGDLRAGQLGELGPMAERKAALITRIEAQIAAGRGPRGGAAEELARVRAIAARNARLLTAVLSGLETARRQVEALHRSGRQLDSYDARGQARRIAAPPPGLERKV